MGYSRDFSRYTHTEEKSVKHLPSDPQENKQSDNNVVSSVITDSSAIGTVKEVTSTDVSSGFSMMDIMVGVIVVGVLSVVILLGYSWAVGMNK